jgi:hypothetical protein
VCPICADPGHEPWLAAGSPHNGTLESIPNNPGGICTLTPPRPCSPSRRENDTLNGLNPFASLLTVPAVNDGANGNEPAHAPPPALDVIANESPGEAVSPGVGFDGSDADHGVISLVV